MVAPSGNSRLLLLALMIGKGGSLTFPFAQNNDSKAAIGTVQVCQNKDCCQRWGMTYHRLPETLQDLLPPDVVDRVQVESTSCLSLCGKGPNMCIKKPGSKDIFLNGISGPMSLADELQEKLGIEVPSKLVAAVTVMEKAHKASLPEKERFYSSVIDVLKSDPAVSSSCAYARALALRAEARQEQGGADEAVVQDGLLAAQVPGSTPAIKALAWRTLADCYRGQGLLEPAVEALQHWAQADPSSRTKVQNEITQLQLGRADTSSLS